MARDFEKDGFDRISFPANTYGSRMHGASAMSVHAWINWDTISATGNANRIFNTTIQGSAVSGVVLFISAGGEIALGARSTAADGFQIKTHTAPQVAGVWYGVGGTANYGAGSIVAVHNGSMQSGSATFGSATYVQDVATNNDSIGTAPSVSSTNQFDGRIAEVGVWNTALSQDEWTSLSQGVTPDFIRPQSLIGYIPLWGAHASEPDLVSGEVGTIQGGVASAPHCRAVGWRQRHRAIRSSAAPAANPFFFNRHVLSRRAG